MSDGVCRFYSSKIKCIDLYMYVLKMFSEIVYRDQQFRLNREKGENTRQLVILTKYKEFGIPKLLIP